MDKNILDDQIIQELISILKKEKNLNLLEKDFIYLLYEKIFYYEKELIMNKNNETKNYFLNGIINALKKEKKKREKKFFKKKEDEHKINMSPLNKNITHLQLELYKKQNELNYLKHKMKTYTKDGNEKLNKLNKEIEEIVNKKKEFENTKK